MIDAESSRDFVGVDVCGILSDCCNDEGVESYDSAATALPPVLRGRLRWKSRESTDRAEEVDVFGLQRQKLLL